jgi:fatty acid CoA ligase FadD9
MNTVVRMDVGAEKDETRAARVTARHERLLATDPQYRAAMPLESIGQLKKDPAVRMAQLVAAVMEACADRPALGRRATRIVTDATGRRSQQLLDHFETTTYREVWTDVRALASVWQHDDHVKARPGDLVCILGFAGAGYVIADLAATHVGAVSVPLQTNASISTLTGIVAETQPRCLATSIESLDTAVEIVIGGHRPASLVVFEYCAEDDDQRQRCERAAARLVQAGATTRLETMQSVCRRGRALPAPTLFVPGPDDDPLTTIYYTSGSTGSPKGAMLGERMSSIAWRAPDARPMITVNYMPMNHSFGRILAFRTLAAGGTCYFAAKSDLSTLFEDVQRVRPTFVNLVTRICEMIHQRYQAELAARGPEARPADVEADVRERQFGGRLMAAAFGAAPMSAELHIFIERCLDVALPNGYGATEIMGVTMNNKVMRPPIIDWKLADVPELGYFRTDKPYPRGELLVKSHTMMQGYYKKPDITKSVFDEDGYYKTGDVMAQVGPDELIYVDRRNNVQKLAQGEFVAIAQLESTFTGGHPLIHQVYLYGTSDRAFLLAVIVPNREAIAREGLDPTDADAVKSRLREAIQQVAQAEHLQSYEVPRELIVELEPFSAENGLLTGVGKPKRPSLKENYAPRLEALYDEIAAKQSGEIEELRRDGRHAPVLATLVRAVRATLGIEEIDTSSALSFGDLGGDSLSALSLSMLLEEIYELEVPVGVITHPAGNLRKLADYIERARKAGSERPTFASVHGRDASMVHATDLTLEKFLDPATLERALKLPPVTTTTPRSVLLTGANGYLGRFLCLEWLERLARAGGRLVCIVRGADAAEARQRIVNAFDSGDAELLSHFRSLAAKHLEVHAGDLAEHHLGLDDDTWRRLAETVDVIVHPAALVNHVLPYAQLFGPNVVGTAELIRLALSTRLKRFANVSTVAVAFAPGLEPLDEDADVRIATPARSLRDAGYASGYATSKWAAEVLLRDANARFGIPVANFRSDMILAHSRYRGQLNVPDMFTRWIFSIVQTGLAPRSFYRAPADRAHYDGLPVDFTAASVVALGEEATTGFQTYHVVNPHDDGISMDDFVEWISASGHHVQCVDDYGDWFARFETALKALPEKQRHQSLLPLLHQLRQPMLATPGAAVSARRFHGTVRRVGVGVHSDIPHLSAALIEKYLADLHAVGLLDDSQ